jgi:hypothetical protein
MSAPNGREDVDAELLSAVTEEAKSLWVPRAAPEAELVEAEDRLFARLDAHDAALAQRAISGGSASFWGPVAFITAVAAGVLLFSHPPSHRQGDGPSSDAARSALPSEPVSSTPSRPTAPAELAAVTGGGEVRVDGVGAFGAGVSLHDGENLEARGGMAAFSAPGRVDWLLENGTEVTAVRAGNHGGAIVLGLRVGAVEAQVTPVPAGEAFAVDVEGVRVAVHGTHLRVARAERGGSWVVVDLSEGVISVGAPPKTGSTVGHLVTAPAHVEFSVMDLEGTLRVEHDPARVRAPVDPLSLAAPEPPSPSGNGTHPLGEVGVAALPARPSPASADMPVATPTAAGMRGRLPPVVVAPPTPLERLSTAVRSCADQTNHGGTGSVTISSMLTVDVKDDGLARLASFDPPLVPDLQACVAAAVYSIQWGKPGSNRIPIELHR